MGELTAEQIKDLKQAFDLTQDSGYVDQYGAKKMLQIFNMNPTTEDVAKRYHEHGKEASQGVDFEEFRRIFHEFLLEHNKVQDSLNSTLADLFDGPVSKVELRKILTEMGSEPFEPEEADEVISEISFDENGLVTQEALKTFLLNRVEMKIPTQKPETRQENGGPRDSPEVAPAHNSGDGDE